MPSAKSSKHTQCPVNDLQGHQGPRSSPDPRVCLGFAHPLQKIPSYLTLHLPKDPITCVCVAGSDLNPGPQVRPLRGWRPHTMRSLSWTKIKRGLTAHLLRPLFRNKLSCLTVYIGISFINSFFYFVYLCSV